jgi:hypothetical protein
MSAPDPSRPAPDVSSFAELEALAARWLPRKHLRLHCHPAVVLLLVRTIPGHAVRYHSLLGVDIVPDARMEDGAWELLDDDDLLESGVVAHDLRRRAPSAAHATQAVGDSWYGRRDDAGWSSSVARWTHTPEVSGSNPLPATGAPDSGRARRRPSEPGLKRPARSTPLPGADYRQHKERGGGHWSSSHRTWAYDRADRRSDQPPPRRLPPAGARAVP